MAIDDNSWDAGYEVGVRAQKKADEIEILALKARVAHLESLAQDVAAAWQRLDVAVSIARYASDKPDRKPDCAQLSPEESDPYPYRTR